jgi:hypothetical protein
MNSPCGEHISVVILYLKITLFYLFIAIWHVSNKLVDYSKTHFFDPAPINIKNSLRISLWCAIIEYIRPIIWQQ